MTLSRRRAVIARQEADWNARVGNKNDFLIDIYFPPVPGKSSIWRVE